MKLIILDGYSINPGDLSWAPIEAIATFHSYDRSRQDEIVSRIGDSDGFLSATVKSAERRWRPVLT